MGTRKQKIPPKKAGTKKPKPELEKAKKQKPLETDENNLLDEIEELIEPKDRY